MICPTCGSLRTEVWKTFPQPGLREIRRRRECLSCGFRWTTHEVSMPRALLDVLRGFGDVEILMLAERARDRRAKSGG